MACARACRPVGEALEIGLPMLSLDLVGIVAEYAVCGPATTGAEPRHLFTFGYELPFGCKGITTSPDCSQIWACFQDQLRVFDGEGECLLIDKQHGLISTPFAVAVDNEHAFVTEWRTGSVVMLGRDGSEKRRFVKKQQLKEPTATCFFTTTGCSCCTTTGKRAWPSSTRPPASSCGASAARAKATTTSAGRLASR